MNFSFTPEQNQFRDALRRFTTDHVPTTAVRAIMASPDGYDAGLWRRLHTDLALPGLCLPEQYGGAGFGMIELGIAMEELGRALLPSPYFASAVVAGQITERLATEAQKQRYLPAIASGSTIATFAYMESTAHEGECRLRASGHRLSGAKRFVIDGHIADQLLVLAADDAGLGVYLVEGTDPGVRRTLAETIDTTRRVAHIEFDQAVGVRLGDGDAASALDSIFDIAAIALANESIGGAARLFDDTLAYLKLRRQFGRTIASFQAIKHRMANLLLTLELARSAAYQSAQAWDGLSPDRSMIASLAKAAACDAYVQTAAESIQLHGGIGFTWEHDTHLWFKRARGSEVLYGSSDYHRAKLVRERRRLEAA